MGTRSAAETSSAIFLAFIESNTWSQAGLARHLGLHVKTVRRHLEELSRLGYPLEAETDHPHVYWSVPRDWFPGGVTFTASEAAGVVRLLLRSPRTDLRRQLLQKLFATDPTSRGLAALESRITVDRREGATEDVLAAVEDAIARRTVLHFRYFSAHRGTFEWRHASPFHVTDGHAHRFAARCHRDDRLKWFRSDNASEARLAAGEDFRAVGADEQRAFVERSVDGFHSDTPPVACRVFLRLPECRWAEKTAPRAMHVEAVPDGVLLSAELSALMPLARWIVGLGGIARVESPPALRSLVHELAAAALAAHLHGDAIGTDEQ